MSMLCGMPNCTIRNGYFDPYFDGLLYLFSLMHLSGEYRIITPGMN
ncbi:MAG TPA: hypothetical protein VFC65_11930 [Prolixibacteraceae bacterium]|nr:hypothetical protein [Prolixibacteraceae bacterium]